ncbi:hypothetical protein TKK_0014472 [Trichogramma kaykai]|uniref:Uncharacterized protein n=1 Tax=Trichogramma kaykai TaxID=54128 RepID=A0ABD2WDW2_9HYME
MSGETSSSCNFTTEFRRTSSASKEWKIKQFWKFLDSGEGDLQPYMPPKPHILPDPDETPIIDVENNADEAAACSNEAAAEEPRMVENPPEPEYGEETRRLMHKFSSENLKFPDEMLSEKTFDFINNELSAFERRMWNCSCDEQRCVCK